MAKISLHPYSITIRRKGSKIDEDITNLFETNNNLSDIIIAALSKYTRKPFLQKETKKALKFEKSPQIAKDKDIMTIQSLVYYGEYGIIRKIMDTKTGDIDEKSINPEKTPVYDLIFTYFEDDLIKNKGYLIAQTYSGRGYKTIFTELIRTELCNKFGGDLTVEINPLVSRNLVDIMKKEDRITDIILTSHDVTKDRASRLLSDNSHTIDIDHLKNINLSLSSSKNKSLISLDKIEEVTSALKRMLLNSKDTAFYEITKSEIKEISVKITSPIKDFTVTIDSSDLEFKEAYFFDDDTVIKADGRIAHTYILNEAKIYSTVIAQKYRKP